MNRTENITLGTPDHRTYVLQLKYNDTKPITWVNWRLVDVVAVESRSVLGFRKRDDNACDVVWGDPDQGDASAHGFFKWDGCGQADVSLHVCRAQDIEDFLQALRQAYAQAARVLGDVIEEDVASMGWLHG